MAHHVIRRYILFAGTTPPVPPTPTGIGDYRLFVGGNFETLIDVTGVEFTNSVTALEEMGQIEIQPIPPASDTGLGSYRLEVATSNLEGPAIPITGIEINGTFAAGGITV